MYYIGLDVHKQKISYCQRSSEKWRGSERLGLCKAAHRIEAVNSQLLIPKTGDHL